MGDRFIQPLRDLWNQIQNVYYTNCTHTVCIYWDCFYYLLWYRQTGYEAAVVGKMQRRIVTNYDFDRWGPATTGTICLADKRENYFNSNVNNCYIDV